MKKFVFLYRGSNQRPGAMQEWIAWFAANGASFADSGNPLAAGRLVTSAGNSDVADFTGYSLVLAADLAAAEALAATSPASDGVQVYEALPM